MNQSAVIFGYLFVAFLVFITMRGELPVYAGFLLSQPKPRVPGSGGLPSNADQGGQLAQTVSNLSNAALFLV